jgi:arylsulfatase A-like enzyme
VDWITKAPNGNADLVMMYFNQPDHENHAHGPESMEVTSAIISMDFFFGQLIAKLQRAGALDKVDVVLVADHGVSAISTTRTVDMSIASNLSAVVYGGSPVTQIWPKDVRLGSLGNSSTPEFQTWSSRIRGPLMAFAASSGDHLSVYERNNMPAHLHYTGHLVAPFVAITAPGWIVKSLYPGSNKGAHG